MAKQKLKSKTSGGVKLKTKAAPKKKASTAKKKILNKVKIAKAYASGDSAIKKKMIGAPKKAKASVNAYRKGTFKGVAKQYGLRTGKNIVTGKKLGAAKKKK